MATAALVEQREDEAMANYFDFHKNEIKKSKGSSFQIPFESAVELQSSQKG